MYVTSFLGETNQRHQKVDQRKGCDFLGWHKLAPYNFCCDILGLGAPRSIFRIEDFVMHPLGEGVFVFNKSGGQFSGLQKTALLFLEVV